MRRSRVNVGTGGARLQKGCTGATAYATAYATRPMQAIGMSAAAHLVVDWFNYVNYVNYLVIIDNV